MSGNRDGADDVDRDDISIMSPSRGRPASGAGDPADLDNDGVISVLDLRIAITMGTRSRRAKQ